MYIIYNKSGGPGEESASFGKVINNSDSIESHVRIAKKSEVPIESRYTLDT